MLKTVISRPEFSSIFLKNALKQTRNSFKAKFSTSLKRWDKQLPIKANFSPFCILISLILGLKSVKDLSITKIVKEMTLEGIWDELVSKKCFQRQSFTKYFWLTIVFVKHSALREKFNFLFFKNFLIVIAKFSFWEGDWAVGYYSMGFRHFCDSS